MQHLSTATPFVAFQIGRSLSSRRTALRQPKSPATELGALSSLTSEARLHLHLFGLLSLWTNGSEVLESPNSDSTTQGLVIMQLLSSSASQVFENVAFFTAKGVLPKRLVSMDDGVAKLYRWSNRCWLGCILLQYLILWREDTVRNRRLAESRNSTDNVGIRTGIGKEELRTEIRHWRKSLLANILWTPLCIHWCLEEGIAIPDSVTGFISLMADGWDLHDAWAATAKE